MIRAIEDAVVLLWLCLWIAVVCSVGLLIEQWISTDIGVVQREEEEMKPIDEAKEKKEELAMQYGVPVSSIVWMGNDKFIIITKDKNIEVERR